MIVSRKVVVWSGIIIIILFAIINRIRLYMNSEFIDGTVTTIVLPKEKSSEEDKYLHEIVFEYKNKTYKYDVQFFTLPDNDEKVKVMIPNGKPEDFTLFDFSHFILISIIFLVAISGLWIIFLQSFFPNQQEFYFFKKRNE
jgi:hypothetical protein